MASLEVVIRKLGKMEEEVERLQGVEDKLDVIKDDSERNRIKIRTLERKLAKSQTQVDSLENTVQMLKQTAPEKCQCDCGYNKEKEKRLKRKVETLERESADMQQYYQELKQLQQILNTFILRGVLSQGLNEQVKEIQTNLENLSGQVKDLQNEKTSSHITVRNLKSDLEKISGQVGALLRDVTRSQEFRKLETDLKNLCKDVEVLKTNATNLQQFQFLKTELTKLSKGVTALQSTVASCQQGGKLKPQVDALSKDVEALRKDVTSSQKMVSLNAAKVEQFSKDVGALQSEVASHQRSSSLKRGDKGFPLAQPMDMTASGHMLQRADPKPVTWVNQKNPYLPVMSLIDPDYRRSLDDVRHHNIPLNYDDYIKLAALEILVGNRDCPAQQICKKIEMKAEVYEDYVLSLRGQGILSPELAMNKYIELCTIEGSFPADTKFYFVKDWTGLIYNGDKILGISSEDLLFLNIHTKSIERTRGLNTLEDYRLDKYKDLKMKFDDGTSIKLFSGKGDELLNIIKQSSSMAMVDALW